MSTPTRSIAVRRIAGASTPNDATEPSETAGGSR
jgi:hypothetical protein